MGKKSVFMSNSDSVLLKMFAIRPEKHNDISIFKN